MLMDFCGYSQVMCFRESLCDMLPRNALWMQAKKRRETILESRLNCLFFAFIVGYSL